MKTKRTCLGTLCPALLIIVAIAASSQATVYTWDGGGGSWADPNWNGGASAPAEDTAATHTLGYEADDFIVGAGANIVTVDRVVQSGGSLSITSATVEFHPPAGPPNLSGLNLGHDGNGMAGAATTAVFTNSTVVAARAVNSGNGMRVDNSSSLTLSGGSLAVDGFSGPSVNIFLNVRGGGTVSLTNSAVVSTGYLNFGGEVGTITMNSGTLNLSSNDPIRNIASAVVDFIGAAGSASVVHSDNTGVNTLAVRLAAGVFAIDGTVVTDTTTFVSGRRFKINTMGSTDTINLVQTPIFAGGVTVTPAGDPNLVVAEGGVGGNPQSISLDVVLDSEPTQPVTVTPDDLSTPDQVSFVPASLVFSVGNWNIPQSLTISAIDDSLTENPLHTITVDFTVTSSDPNYDSFPVEPVSVKILENDCGSWGYFGQDFNLDCAVNLLDFPNIPDVLAFSAEWLECSRPNDTSCQDVRIQPNIIFIMADDLGWADTSNPLTNMGDPSDFYETPTMDTLAVAGMAFTNAYANQNCAPTRTAILSGAYAPRSTNNVYQVGNLNRGGSGTLLVGPPQGTSGNNATLPTSTITHAETLQSAGYTTAYVGKFHVTDSAGLITSHHGFDQNFGGGTAGGPGNYHASGGTFGSNIGPGLDPYAANYTQAYVDANIKPYANGTSIAAIDALVGTAKHVTDASADAIIDFMNNNSSNPFFIQYSSHAVHSPIGNSQARADLLDKYQNKTPGVEDSNASFGALIEGLDQSVARIIVYLENTADPRNPGKMLSENTLVIFYSDNGGKQSQSNNGTLKGQKGELDDGGIRVPMIAWSGNPNLVDGGTINHTPVMPIDFYKTFAKIAGAALPASQTLDGEDLSGIIADSSATLGRENIYWHLPGYLISSGRDQRPQTVIRSGDWKLLYNYETFQTQPFELYDLSTDIGETTNIANSNAALVLSIGTELMEWLEATNSPLATLRSASQSVFVDGWTYANGVITEYTGQTITINAGEEVPFVLQR